MCLRLHFSTGWGSDSSRGWRAGSLRVAEPERFMLMMGEDTRESTGVAGSGDEEAEEGEAECCWRMETVLPVADWTNMAS